MKTMPDSILICNPQITNQKTLQIFYFRRKYHCETNILQSSGRLNESLPKMYMPWSPKSEYKLLPYIADVIKGTELQPQRFIMGYPGGTNLITWVLKSREPLSVGFRNKDLMIETGSERCKIAGFADGRKKAMSQEM